MSGHSCMKYCIKGIKDIENTGIGGQDELYAAVKKIVDSAWDSESIMAIDAKKDTTSGTLKICVEGDTSTVTEIYRKMESICGHMALETYDFAVSWLNDECSLERQARMAETASDEPDATDKLRYVINKKYRKNMFNRDQAKKAHDRMFSDNIKTSTTSSYLSLWAGNDKLEKAEKDGQVQYYRIPEDIESNVIDGLIEEFEKKYPEDYAIWN